ncbi:MAG: hypothetical protein R3Y21_03245 [Mycoplasmatota bacterium]
MIIGKYYVVETDEQMLISKEGMAVGILDKKTNLVQMQNPSLKDETFDRLIELIIEKKDFGNYNIIEMPTQYLLTKECLPVCILEKGVTYELKMHNLKYSASEFLDVVKFLIMKMQKGEIPDQSINFDIEKLMVEAVLTGYVVKKEFLNELRDAVSPIKVDKHLSLRIKG